MRCDTLTGISFAATSASVQIGACIVRTVQK